MFDGQIARLAQGHDCWLVRCLWDGWVSLARLPARLRGETLLSSLLWTGQPPPANIVVVAESWGGHGDALCMVRYLPLLTECGYRVGYKCAQPGLGKLLRQSFPSDLHFQDEAHIKNNKPVPLRAPTYLFQQQYLCRAFNGKLTPRGVGSGRPNQKLEYRPRKKVNPYVPEKPYLRADPARVEHYRRRIPSGAVGLVWASGVTDTEWGRRMQPRKSLPLADLAPIYERSPCVSLQVGPARAQIAGTPVLDVLPPKPDWAETAALVKARRCVVAVDTGCAHLAGALGVPLHLLLHSEPQPYWNVRGVPSPWYRGVSVHRGKGADWSEAVARIADALGGLAIMHNAAAIRLLDGPVFRVAHAVKGLTHRWFSALIRWIKLTMSVDHIYQSFQCHDLVCWNRNPYG